MRENLCNQATAKIIQRLALLHGKRYSCLHSPHGLWNFTSQNISDWKYLVWPKGVLLVTVLIQSTVTGSLDMPAPIPEWLPSMCSPVALPICQISKTNVCLGSISRLTEGNSKPQLPHNYSYLLTQVGKLWPVPRFHQDSNSHYCPCLRSKLSQTCIRHSCEHLQSHTMALYITCNFVARL